MGDDVTFPQHGDEPDAAFFAASTGTFVEPGFILGGMGFIVDYNTPSFDVNPGRGFVVDPSMDTATGDIATLTLEDVGMRFEYAGESGLSLNSDAVNEIYLAANLGTNNSPHVNVNPPSPSDGSIKIGEIDTASDEKSQQWHLWSNGVLSFPDQAAADEAAANLREGIIVYDRANNNHYFVG